MKDANIRRAVTISVALATYQKQNKRFIPAAVSNRHVHLCEKDIEILFGAGYQLGELKPLSQPGQFAAKETVDIEGPKGTIKGLRVLGPARSATQAEVFYADTYRLGIPPVLRISGDTAGTPGARLIGPKGIVQLSEGVIIAARHIHISENQGRTFRLKNGDVVSVKKDGERGVVFENIPIRCGQGHSMELHLDMEEANAGMIKNGELLEIVKVKQGR